MSDTVASDNFESFPVMKLDYRPGDRPERRRQGRHEAADRDPLRVVDLPDACRAS